MAYDSKTLLYLTFELLVACLSILGNTLVTASFVRDRSLRTPTNLFVFSLALADLLVSAVATPIYAHSMLTKLPHDFHACLCVHTLILTFCTVSIFHLIAVSFDRYMAIVWRRRPVSHERGMRRAAVSIASAWISGILVGCLPLMGWNAGNTDLQQCEFLSVISMSYLMFLFYATIIAPTALMAFFYGSLYYAVRKQNERMFSARYSVDSRASMCSNGTNRLSVSTEVRRQTTADCETGLLQDQPFDMVCPQQEGRSASVIAVQRAAAYQKRQQAKAKKIIFSLLLVIICFFLSWYPLYTMNAVLYYCEKCKIENWWFYGPIILSHLSSVMNPFIYARTMPGYREAFIETLTCGKIIAKPTSLKNRRSALLTDFEPKRASLQRERQKNFDNDDLRVM